MSKRKIGLQFTEIGVCILLASLLTLTTLFSQPIEDKSFEEVKLIQELHMPELFRIPGVVGVGIGKDEDGQWILHTKVDVDEGNPLLLPIRINGVPVVPFPAGRAVLLDSCALPPAPCQHRNPQSFPIPGAFLQVIRSHLAQLVLLLEQ